MVAAVPVNHKYLVAVDNDQVLKGWEAWVILASGRADAAHASWRRIAKLVKDKWPYGMPFRLIHVYSHVQDKLKVPEHDTQALAAKRARIVKETEQLQDREGCAKLLQAANVAADELANKGLLADRLELPAVLVGESPYRVKMDGKVCRDWAEVQARWHQEDADFRLAAAVQWAWCGKPYFVDRHLSLQIDWQVLNAASTAAGLLQRSRREFLFRLAGGALSPQHQPKAWKVLAKCDEAEPLKKLNVWKRCVYCNSPWSLSHAWNWCAEGCRQLAPALPAGVAWNEQIQAAVSLGELKGAVARHLQSLFAPVPDLEDFEKGARLESALHGWWPAPATKWTNLEAKQVASWRLRWISIWQKSLHEIRRVLWSHYLKLVEEKRALLAPSSAVRNKQLGLLRKRQPAQLENSCRKKAKKQRQSTPLDSWLNAEPGKKSEAARRGPRKKRRVEEDRRGVPPDS
jgi:hypothetical protein